MHDTTDRNLQYLPQAPAGAGTERFSAEERAVLDLVNQKIAAAQSVAEIVDFLFDAMQSIYPCDRIGLAFLDDDGARLTSYLVRARYEPICLRNGFSGDLQESSLRTVIERGTPRVINDLPAYLAAHPQSVASKLLVREGVRSSMTCPLKVEDRVVGVLFRSSRAVAAYDEHQVRLHEAIAERLSQAVEKAYRIEQLAAANRAYTELLGFVSHELKSPLAGLVMEGHSLAGGYLGQLTDAQKERVQKMMGRAQYLLNLIRDYLDLARVEGGDLELKPQPGVEFGRAVVAPAIEIGGAGLKEKSMRLSQAIDPEDLAVDCDPGLMVIVMANLISNAVKYGKEGGEIRVSARREAGQLRVTVWNEGIGFRESDRNALFKKFSRLSVPEFQRIKGTGVGLYTTWRIIQLHRGVIRARSEPGQWAEFEFTIPVADG